MLYRLTAHEAIDLIKKKEVKCQEVVQSVLDRIEQVEDKVKAYITITKEEALENAKKIDEKIAKGEDVGVLYGLPIALKDNLCTDGIKTTCASKILYNFVPPYDATVVKKLKENDMTLLASSIWMSLQWAHQQKTLLSTQREILGI